jgi:hypothetical protein
VDSSKKWPLVLLGLLLASGPGAAGAETAGRTAVIVVEGGPGDAVTSLIAGHIAPPHTVRDAKAFLTALTARGTAALAPAVGNRTLDAQLVARARGAASEAHVDVAILVAHRKARRAVRAHLWVIDARGEGALFDEDLASTTASDEAEAAWTASASLFPAATKEAPPPANPPPPPASEPTAETAPPAGAPVDQAQTTTPDRASEGPTRRTALVVVQASVEAGSRHLSYVDRITANLRPYDLFAAPLVSIAAEAYPLSRMRVPPPVTGLGVTGDYARAFALSSADAAGARVGTHWQAFDLDLRDRIALSQTMALGVNLGYGAIDFDFDRPGSGAVLPSVAYRFLRAGFDLRVDRGDLSVFCGGAYLPVLSAGNSGGRMGGLFPRESVGGVEARLGAAYVATAGFELSLGIGYTRFFYSMHPQPGDANVAGGALDEMARLSLSLAYLL